MRPPPNDIARRYTRITVASLHKSGTMSYRAYNPAAVSTTRSVLDTIEAVV